jgi:hypothetical protein
VVVPLTRRHENGRVTMRIMIADDQAMVRRALLQAENQQKGRG